MSQQTINLGNGANSGTGDSIRTAFSKVNENFNELYFGSNLDNNNSISSSGLTFLNNLVTASTSTLTSRVLALETTSTNITARVIRLESTATALTNTVTNLITRAGNIEAAATTLTNTVTNLITRVGNIEAAATTLTNTVTNLITRVGNIEAAATTLTNTVTNLITRVGNIEAAATTLTNTVTNLISTVTNLSSRIGTLEGFTAVPRGMIMIWSGSAPNIPNGWILCNGLNGTPDLRDRFVMGAGATYVPGVLGGTSTSVVVSHNHIFTGNPLGGHQHTTPTPSTWSVSGSGPVTYTSGSPVDNSGFDGVSNSVSAGTPSGYIGSTGSDGVGKNLPPFYTLCYVMKT